MISLLLASAPGLLFVAALGITGLANFWVQQRTRSIGIRRALGATPGNILGYFQTENFLVVTFGVALGALLAIGLNLLSMEHYQLPRLPLWYLAVGAVALWVLGQLVVLAPALRASRVQPVVAMRSTQEWVTCRLVGVSFPGGHSVHHGLSRSACLWSQPGLVR